MGKRKTPIVKTYHVRYVCDVLVQATSTKDAYTRSDMYMYDLLDTDLGLDDVFEITLENSNFNIVPEDYFDSAAEDDDEEDDACELDDDDDDDDDEEDDDDEDEDEE